MSIERDQFRAMIILGVMTGIFGLGFWLPNHLHENRLHAQLKMAEDSLKAEQHDPEKLAVMVRQVSDLKALTLQSQKYVPQSDELADLLRQLSIELERQRVTGQEIQTGTIIHGQEYSVVPITLRFKGSFPAVFGFLQRIESMQRMIRVTKLDFDGDAAHVNELLSVRIELYTFFAEVKGAGQ